MHCLLLTRRSAQAFKVDVWYAWRSCKRKMVRSVAVAIIVALNNFVPPLKSL